MSRKRDSVNDPVSRIPAAADARSIKKHIDTQSNSFLRQLRAIADRELFDGNDTKSRWYDPTRRAGNPGPPVLVGIKANVAVSSLEFPPPEPMRFAAPFFDEPAIGLLAGARKISHPVEGAESKGGCPTALRISRKCRPSAIASLQMQQKFDR